MLYRKYNMPDRVLRQEAIQAAMDLYGCATYRQLRGFLFGRRISAAFTESEYIPAWLQEAVRLASLDSGQGRTKYTTEHLNYWGNRAWSHWTKGRFTGKASELDPTWRLSKHKIYPGFCGLLRVAPPEVVLQKKHRLRLVRDTLEDQWVAVFFVSHSRFIYIAPDAMGGKIEIGWKFKEGARDGTFLGFYAQD